MLVEYADVSQDPVDFLRRWFGDDYFDLIVWYDAADSIKGFQLCYDKREHERALTWMRDKGYSHDRIDKGRVPFQRDVSPILAADGLFDKDGIAERFRKDARNIDRAIADFVYRRLKTYQAAGQSS